MRAQIDSEHNHASVDAVDKKKPTRGRKTLGIQWNMTFVYVINIWQLRPETH